MTITERLIKLDPTLTLHNEGEWGSTILEYSAFNNGGVECEVGEFLYGLIRVLKPDKVLETGTHFGIGASYMGLALLDNGKGSLTTLEFLPEIYEIAKSRMTRLGFSRPGLSRIVNCELLDAANYTPTGKLDLIFLDTEPQTRFAELLKFYPYVKEGGYMFIHDLHPHMHQIPNDEHGFAWPYGVIPEAMVDLVRFDKLRPFHFRTPRGMSGFYKTAESDYKWI